MEPENPENNTNNNQKEQTEQINKIIPLINQNENNVEFILMEKDKKIISLSEKNDRLILDLENLSNELKNKNMEISSLKSDITSLNNEKKLFEEEIKKNQEEITKLNDIIKEKDKIIQESNSNNDTTNKKYIDLLEEQQKETTNMAEKNLKLQDEINELNAKLIKKDRDIVNLENIICRNREKDSQILLLKKDIKEKEKSIKEFQNKLIIANNDLKTSQNFNEERMKQLYEHKNDNKNDSNIISFVINKIQNLILFVDNTNFGEYNKSIDENIIEIKEDDILYDLLEQNISILKNKIFSKYNFILKQNKENTNKYQLEKSKNEELMKTLQQIKINYNEKIELLNQKINQIQNNLKSKEEEIKISNNKILELNKTSSGALSENIFNKFYSNIITKINKNYLKDMNLDNKYSVGSNETKLNNVLNIIDFFVEKLNNLNNFVKEYEIYKIKVKEMINKKLNKSNDQSDEINELKNNIQELNVLLNQSNNYLNESRKENNSLKKRILNLEKSINMISKNNLLRNNNESKYLLTYNNDNNNLKNNFLLDD